MSPALHPAKSTLKTPPGDLCKMSIMSLHDQSPRTASHSSRIKARVPATAPDAPLSSAAPGPSTRTFSYSRLRPSTPPALLSSLCLECARRSPASGLSSCFCSDCNTLPSTCVHGSCTSFKRLLAPPSQQRLPRKCHAPNTGYFLRPLP